LNANSAAAQRFVQRTGHRERVGTLTPLSRLDGNPYSPYSYGVKSSRRQVSKGVEEARQQLPAILAAAAAGRSTIITRHGKAVAAVVPAAHVRQNKPASLQALAGSGRGMWGRDSSKAIAKLRDEWNR